MEGLSFSNYHIRDQLLFHVYTEQFSPLHDAGQQTNSWFNGSGTGIRRFDPIYNAQGRIIPGFYAAFSWLVALSETIIHQPPSAADDSKLAFTPPLRKLNWRPETPLQQQQGLTKGIAQFMPRRELILIDLETVQTPGNNKPLKNWLKQGEKAYPALHTVSTWFAQRCKDHDGLIWNSGQRNIPGDRALMLFGDRVTNSDLQLLNHQPFNSSLSLDRIRDAVRTFNVITPEWLIK